MVAATALVVLTSVTTLASAHSRSAWSAFARAEDGLPSFRAEYSYDGLGRVTRASLDAGRP